MATPKMSACIKSQKRTTHSKILLKKHGFRVGTHKHITSHNLRIHTSTVGTYTHVRTYIYTSTVCMNTHVYTYLL